MREIVLDTETTGFEPEAGDRIVEIGAIELFNHMPTGRKFHKYVNPQRAMPQEAFAVHGLGDEFLQDKPLFAEIAEELLEFIGDAMLVIHNAAFDMKFLNAELGWLRLPSLPWERAVDTLAIARQKFPGAPASLDALCRRFAIDNSSRTLHGALLDSEILAEVYLELIGSDPVGHAGAIRGRADGIAGLATGAQAKSAAVPPDTRRAGRPPGLCRPDGRGGALEQTGSGVGALTRGICLTPGDFVAIELHEVDVLEVERRESTVAGDIADDAADERKDHARAFDQQEGVQLILWHALDVEHAHVIHLHNEKRILGPLVARGDGQFDRGFELVLGAAFLGVEIDGDLHIGLHLAARAALCQHIFK